MYVVSHPAVHVYAMIMAFKTFLKAGLPFVAIFVGKVNGLPAISAQYDVVVSTRKVKSGFSRHQGLHSLVRFAGIRY